MPTARGFGGAAVTNSRIYVIGGEDGHQTLGVNEAYTPEQDVANSNPWQTFPPLPAGRSHMGVVSIAGIIHVLGNQPATYSEEKQTWALLAPPAAGLNPAAGVAVLGTTIEVLGGQGAAAPSAQNIQYQAIFVITLPAVGS
jgi:hypothetical protein